MRAIEALAAGGIERAGAVHAEILAEHPRDVLALGVAHSCDYIRGDLHTLRLRAERSLGAWRRDLPGYHALLAMYAFALEEAGHYARAEDYARRALEIAPRDDYRVALQIDERDISQVADGQHGQLTVASIPGKRFGFTVSKITPVNTAKEGRNFFRVEASLSEPPGSRLRPGMEGVGKIDIDERKLVWIWTHSFTDWVRLWLWSWMP